MNENKTITLNELNFYDMLTVDVYDKVISITNKGVNEILISKKQFFSKHGLYVEPEKNGLVLINNNTSTKSKRKRSSSTIEKLLSRFNTSSNSIVALIEGFAGCGKSTLVQSILISECETYSDYGLYNYNIEAQNDEITHDKSGNKIANSSIFNAIKKCFINQFCKVFNKANVLTDFMTLANFCQNFSQFNPIYFSFVNTDTFTGAIENLRSGEIDTAKKILYAQLSVTDNHNSVLALDYLLRLSMWKNKLVEKLYICYDNLDAIEDAEDLAGFDNRLVKFRNIIDNFITQFSLHNTTFFSNRPHFIIMATYRKITAVLAELDNVTIYEENDQDDPEANFVNRVIRIDATSTYSYKKIVAKRKEYFISFFKRYFENDPRLSRKYKTIVDHQLKMLDSWDSLNQNLEIMNDRYSILWNRNYRTCSLIAYILFSENYYDFESYISFINESAKSYDGYLDECDDEGNKVLCTYFGRSAILLNSVCRVFNIYKVWDNTLLLTRLYPDNPDVFQPAYYKVSLSRMILTYIYNNDTYNNKAVSLKDLYKLFCQNNLFTVDLLCKSLSKMLEREKKGVWRRPIYYANKCILAVKAKNIENILLNECKLIEKGELESDSYMFQLCEAGRAYVEHLMFEFEFFSNRLSAENKPLYMYSDIEDQERILNDVFNAVHNCCENMICFKKQYMNLNNKTQDEYLQLDIHPRTNRGFHQLHTERIIFSHVAYLNNARLYFLDRTENLELRIKYNDIFVNYISKYLKLYEGMITSISTDRMKVCEDLKNIVKEIQEEKKKETPDARVLFKSIDLKKKATINRV